MAAHQLADPPGEAARRGRSDLQAEAPQHPAQAHLYIVVLRLKQLACGQ
jgi:hypothetical protein